MASMNGSSSTTAYCSHCKRHVPAANFDLHSAHCQRNLKRCEVCEEMVAFPRAVEHYNELHAPIPCSNCGSEIERDLLYIHEHEKCPRRMVACVYCEFPVVAADLQAHSDLCGNRTEMCLPCGKYVRLRERIAHDLQFHDDNSAPETPAREHISTCRPAASARALPSSNSRHKLLFTLAVTGAAIVIGTFVLQRRGPSNQQQ